MDMVIKYIDDEPRNLYGVNSDLISWMEDNESDPTVKEGLFRGDLDLRKYIDALGARDPRQRRLKSIKIVRELWESCPELGPYPLQETLKESEDLGVFYQKYRDHSAHQLFVYVLGLYIYHSCQTVRNALNQEILGWPEITKEKKARTTENVRERFIFRWMAASLLHDIGYVLENEEADDYKDGNKARFFPKIMREIENVLENPVSKTRHFIDTISEDTENNLNDGLNHLIAFPLPKLNQIKDLLDFEIPPAQDEYLKDFHQYLEIANGTEKKLLQHLSKNTAASAFGVDDDEGAEYLQKYYETAKEYNPDEEGRSGYYDHGISSALIFLKCWLEYTRKIILVDALQVELEKGKKLTKGKLKLFSDFRRKYLEKEEIYQDIWAAAGAMSLHNINLRNWKTNIKAFQGKGEGLDLTDFKIHLHRENNHRGTPLSFLLCLTDALQDWGRPFFSPLLDYERHPEMEDSDLSIQCINDKIRVVFRADLRTYRKKGLEEIDKNERKHPESKFAGLKEQLLSNLAKEAIGDLVHINILEDEKSRIELNFSKCDREIDEQWKKQKLGATPTPPADSLTKEEVNKLKALTGKNFIKNTIYLCPNFTEKEVKKEIDFRKCNRHARSILAVAELDRSAVAFSEVEIILIEMVLISEVLSVLRRALDSFKHIEPDAIFHLLTRLEKTRQDLLGTITKFDRTNSYAEEDILEEKDRFRLMLNWRVAIMSQDDIDKYLEQLEAINTHPALKGIQAKNTLKEKDYYEYHYLIERVHTKTVQIYSFLEAFIKDRIDHDGRDKNNLHGRDSLIAQIAREGLDREGHTGYHNKITRLLAKRNSPDNEYFGVWGREELK